MEREFGHLKNEWALAPLRVRGLDRVRLHADLTILIAPYRLARFIVVVLVLIGVAALTLRLLGLANVEFVTDHFHIH